MDLGGVGLKIEIDTAANTLSYTLDDGSVAISDSFAPAADLDDGTVRHFALCVDRANGARLYLNGTESTGLSALGALGDITNSAPIIVGGNAVIANNYVGDLDNIRLALNAVYDVTSGTLTVPITGFIEFQEELFDEYQTDIRIVDEGDLNKTLILRILNLMRPASERINVVFIRFFDDFLDGIGQFETLAGSAAVNTSGQMELQPGTTVRTDVLGDSEFRDIVLQVKAEDTDVLGGIFSIQFLIQDASNFYEYRINTATATVSLFKIVAGVPTQIGADVSEDIVPATAYIYTVVTSFDVDAGLTKIQTFVDSNKQHEVLDGAFNKGKFGMETDGSTVMQVEELEMLPVPTSILK